LVNSRRRTVALGCVAAKILAACALVTDLGGLADGQRSPAPPSDAGGDTVPEGGMHDAAGEVPPPDTGADVPSNALSYDDFENAGSCGAWLPYLATAESVTAAAFAGARSCRICLTKSGASGGILRRYPGTGAGTYRVRARMKKIVADDWRFTMRFEVDGGDEPYYASGAFISDDWQDVGMTKTVGAGFSNLEVAIWFGTAFQVGDCILVDEVTVSRDP
jgi:hypothetical protein